MMMIEVILCSCCIHEKHRFILSYKIRSKSGSHDVIIGNTFEAFISHWHSSFVSYNKKHHIIASLSAEIWSSMAKWLRPMCAWAKFISGDSEGTSDVSFETIYELSVYAEIYRPLFSIFFFVICCCHFSHFVRVVVVWFREKVLLGIEICQRPVRSWIIFNSISNVGSMNDDKRPWSQC